MIWVLIFVVIVCLVLLSKMIAVKKAVKTVVNKDQKRILVISMAHDDDFLVKGDNATGQKRTPEGRSQARG